MTPSNQPKETSATAGRASTVVPLLALLASVTALGVGTSLAKQLFPQVGSLGTTALRVGFSALLLLAIWRPWRWALSRTDAASLAVSYTHLTLPTNREV